MMRARGMPSANEEFETLAQVGRFIQHWPGHDWTYIFRMDVKLAVCGAAHAKDANVRVALIDLWGGETKAVGGKRCDVCKGTGERSIKKPACSVCGGAVCPACKNRRVVGRKKESCPACRGVVCPLCDGKPATGRVMAACDCRGGWRVPKGPLYGMSGDMWAALGIAYAWGLNPLIRQYLTPSNKPKRKLAVETTDGGTGESSGEPAAGE